MDITGTKAKLRVGFRLLGAGQALVVLLSTLLSMHAGAAARPTFRTDPTYLIDTWETEDGLPENSATAMAQTPEGYLWFGTFGGLVRFDGVNFTVMTPSNTPGLPHSGIVNLYLDKGGRMWVSTYGGLAILEKGAWRTVGKEQGWEGDFVRSFTERPNGDLLITAFNGTVMEFVAGKLVLLPAPPGTPARGYTSAVDGDGHWWVAQNRFIGWWDGRRWISAVDPLPDAKDEVGCATAADGGVWIRRGIELIKMRAGKEVSRIRLSIIPGGHWSMCEDRHGSVWICSFNGGVSRVAPDGQMQRWNDTNGLVHKAVRFVHEDRENNVWVGTSGGGLNRFKPRRFRSYGVESGLPERVVRSTWPAPGGAWVATYGRGLFRLQGATVTPVQVSADPAVPGYVQSILTDRAGRTWVGSDSEGLWQVDSSGARRVASGKIGGDNVTAQFEDSHGRIWIGDGRGVTVFDGETSSIYGAPQGIPACSVRCFAEDSEGTVWLTNLEGVFRWEGNRFVEFRWDHDVALKNISCLWGDAAGAIWMGCAEGGLLRWRNNRMGRIDVAAGLPAVNVLGILCDDSGRLWMASNRGVILADRAGLEAVADGTASHVDAVLLGTEDGLPGVECAGGIQPMCAKDAGGRLWFATMKGIAVIDPASFKINSQPPSIEIERLVYYTPADSAPAHVPITSPGGGSGQWHPVLPPGSRRIEVHYTALSFAAPEKVRFQVKLQGKELDWQDINDRRIAYFHDLEPRDYLFRVRAANNDGVWSTTDATLAFTVQPFYWQTRWFQSGMALLLVLLGAAIYWRISRLRNRVASEAQQRMHQVFEASPHAILAVNDQGVILMVNQQTKAMFGYLQEELIGETIEILVPEGTRARHSDDRRAYLASHGTRPMAARRNVAGRHKDGSLIPVEIGLSAIRTRNGLLVLASIMDITARRQAEKEALRQRNEMAHLSRVTMMGELSGSIAHELNQPLTAILSNAQAALRYLARGSADLEEVRGILLDIVDEDKRAGEVIRQLRLLFRKGDVQFLPLDLNEVIADAIRMLHSDLISQNVIVDEELAKGLPKAYGDRVQLQQVLINLIMNGCDAMLDTPSPQRRLSVRTESANGDGVKVVVCDRGCGIAPDRLETVFDPFVTTKLKGMGMGLAISRNIIVAHGGRLWAENNPDVGARFFFTVPTQRQGVA